jgi:pyridoxamine 5'-phosphate oxidase
MTNLHISPLTPVTDPWALFASWTADAAQHEPNDPNAMSLATVGQDGMPSVRMVLMKSWSPAGLVFYTNQQSRKGEQLTQHPKAAICFHWKSLQRQLRAEGVVTPVSAAEADAYFASRSRESQLGACASVQSQPLASREELEKRVADLAVHYAGKTVPRPAHWGGYLLVPYVLEFWQNGEHRLHDRFQYTRALPNAPWKMERLNP